MVAVVAGYADVVDVEADTAVGVDAGLEIGDADRYVIDASKDSRPPRVEPAQRIASAAQ